MNKIRIICCFALVFAFLALVAGGVALTIRGTAGVSGIPVHPARLAPGPVEDGARGA